jgi:hypothetical protein
MTVGEKLVVDKMSKLRAERAAVMEQYEVRERDLSENLEAARASADSYERALLTKQSDELKYAVMRALQQIGFDVTDADLSAVSDDHLEDLRIADPDEPNWISLGEVKGYSKGAKTEAFAQFIRFAVRYAAVNGTPPNAMWYIVNQCLGRDPSSRQPALHGKDADVAAFAASGGLVIDTVVLFEILQRVEDGSLDPKEARRHLRESCGRLTVPQGSGNME